MPVTRINCPNCRQPITADVQQLLDVGNDPSAKQKLLSGEINFVQCPACGYQGNLATPIVYHDPEKEMLLTFVPPEIGLPRNEQEKLIGGLINQVVNHLPVEKRKGYLLRPQAVLTMQGLVERVLEGEGITREMLQEQQNRINLIQRLLNTTDREVLTQIAEQEEKLIDAQFFGLLRRLVDASLMSGDENTAHHLAELQETLLPITSYGRELQKETQEIQAALADLQSAGAELNREKLLDLVMNAPTDTRLRALTSLARPLMDYSFFQLLSQHIDRAPEEKKAELASLREKLLEVTRELDKQMEARANEVRQRIDVILNAEDVREAMIQNLPAVDEFFVQEVNALQESARKAGDLELLGKIQKMVEVIQQASAAPPEVALLEELLEAPDQQARQQILQEHDEDITPDFLNALTNIVTQIQGSEEKELAEQLNEIHGEVIKFSMKKNL